MARQRIDSRLKAQALADLMVGESPTVVARRYNLNANTVRHWAQYRQPVADLPTQKKEEIGRLLTEFLEQGIRALTSISRDAQDSTWIKRADPDRAAILAGTLADKLIRLFAAISPEEVEQPGPPRLLPPRDAGLSEPASYSDDDL